MALLSPIWRLFTKIGQARFTILNTGRLRSPLFDLKLNLVIRLLRFTQKISVTENTSGRKSTSRPFLGQRKSKWLLMSLLTQNLGPASSRSRRLILIPILRLVKDTVLKYAR